MQEEIEHEAWLMSFFLKGHQDTLEGNLMGNHPTMANKVALYIYNQIQKLSFHSIFLYVLYYSLTILRYSYSITIQYQILDKPEDSS